MRGQDPVLVRADAGRRMGTGHVMRMLALAQAYRSRHGEVVISSVCCPEGILERLRGEGIGHHWISDCEPGDEDDVAQTIALAESLGSKWVVLDGYHFGVEFQRAVRAAGHKVFCVDDYGHCETWAADGILNQNFHAGGMEYSSEVSGHQVLAGPRFALLRREFWESDPPAREGGQISRILITFGGADEGNASEAVLNALNTIEGEGCSLDIRVLIGASNPHGERLREAAARSKHDVECLERVDDMPGLYRWADAVVGAGGSSCYECLYFGLPAAVMAIADNQVPIVEALRDRELAIVLSVLPGQSDEGEIVAGLTRLVSRGERSSRPAIVDGYGALRVASWLAGSEVFLRPARIKDAEVTFEWANDPVVRRNGFYPDPISWESHQAWFRSKVESPDDVILLAESVGGGPLGQVRFDRRGAGVWEMGILLAETARGRGLARPCAMLGLEYLSRTGGAGGEVIARIRRENWPSMRLFRSLGFETKGGDEVSVEMNLKMGAARAQSMRVES